MCLSTLDSKLNKKMSEGYKVKSGSRQSRRRSVVPKTPDVLRHRPQQSRQRTRSKQDNVQTVRNSSAHSKKNKWYATGYPALRIADKKIRELRARQEDQKLKEKYRPPRKSRSYSRGRSVYAKEDDSRIPYYRSQSVDSTHSLLSTFDPVVNEKYIIRLTYTGSTSRRNSVSRSSNASRRGSVSSRRGSGIVQKTVGSVVPHMRGSYTFDDLQTRIYQQIHMTYGEPDADLKNKQFFQTLAQMQSDHFRMKKMKLNKSDRNFLEKMFEEMKYIQKETGKILENSGKRYSTQFEQPSPVNDKLRSLPKGSQYEAFLKKMPITKENLKLKPLRRAGARSRRAEGYRYANNYSQYESYTRQDLNKPHYQRAKEPNKPSDMLIFLQQAERLLTAYNKGLLSDSMNGYVHASDNLYEKTPTDRSIKLKPLQYRDTHHQPSLHHQKTKPPSYGRTTPLKQLAAHTNAGLKPIQPVYKRPDSFYDARKHMNFHNRANLVSHRLNEAKYTSARETNYTRTFAT